MQYTSQFGTEGIALPGMLLVVWLRGCSAGLDLARMALPSSEPRTLHSGLSSTNSFSGRHTACPDKGLRRLWFPADSAFWRGGEADFDSRYQILMLRTKPCGTLRLRGSYNQWTSIRLLRKQLEMEWSHLLAARKAWTQIPRPRLTSLRSVFDAGRRP